MRATLELYLTIPEAWRPPLMFADGMGVNAAAMKVLLYRMGVRPDAVLHADTGDEHRETVAYRAYINEWQLSIGWPELTIVRRKPSVQGNRKRRDGRTGVSYATLGENCIENAMLPSLATGGRGCSEKWKIEPQEAWASRWSRAIRARGHGQRLWKCIGYDSSKADERRAWRLTSDAEYQYLYPLRDAGWDRGRCQREILAAGLKLPPKSACVYCPASKTWEIARLVRDEPEAADYVCLLEDTARPDMTTVEGLWRNAVKGMRGAVARPGSMAEFIRHCRVDPVYHKYHLDLAPTDPICADVGCDDGLDECNED